MWLPGSACGRTAGAIFLNALSGFETLIDTYSFNIALGDPTFWLGCLLLSILLLLPVAIAFIYRTYVSSSIDKALLADFEIRCVHSDNQAHAAWRGVGWGWEG